MSKISLEKNEEYWDGFYKDLSLSVPSQFCAMVAVEAPKNSAIIEFGCGNGRDSLYFLSQGFTVAAVDLSEEAILSCSRKARAREYGKVEFQVGSLAKDEDIKALFEGARRLSEDGQIIGYSRFVMHSINDEQEEAFLTSLSSAMQAGEKVYLEFRSKEDAELDKTFGNHYRRFVDTDKFVKSMTDKGFKSLYGITGQGMAKYKDEDPFVSRLIFEKI